MLRAFALLIAVACAPEEPGVEVCGNDEDDDRDLLTDCADQDCAGHGCLEQCVDGWDNDNDGLVDCLDPHCDGSCLESCHDGRDNDGDTKLDCADDECSGAEPETCGGLVDDDCDGAIDCLDPDCDGSCPEHCTDDRDNDADGLLDCGDPDCDGHASCPEACTDGRDNDLDGLIDCADTECAVPCDADEDGYDLEAGGGDDCDDTSAAIHPQAPEVCNDGVDDDCDGLADDADASLDQDSTVALFVDLDGDGFGAGYTGDACIASPGTSVRGGDCADSDPYRHPDATEVCGLVDEDCDGLVDDADPGVDESTGLPYYQDIDGDGHGDVDTMTYACAAPDGFVAIGDDCHLFDPAIWDETEWWLDADGDGYGAGVSVWSCAGPEDHAHQSGDCDDADVSLHPGAVGVWPSLRGAWQGNGDAMDTAGLAESGLLVGDVGFVAGVYGDAFAFDGAGDRLEIAHTHSGAFTLSVWIQADLLPQPSAGVVSSSDSDTAPGSLELRFLDVDLQVHSSLTDAAAGVGSLGFVHVAFAYDGADLRTWSAGVPIATEPWTAATPPSFVLLRLGTDRTATYDFEGAIDDVLFFDRGLSDDEVAAIADGAASCLEL